MPERTNTFLLEVSPEKESHENEVIKVDHVSMSFNIANQKLNSLKEYFIAMAKRELMFKEFKALDDISINVNKGDVFGILGTNGSGKSTLLKIIAGILEPTEGSVTVSGNIAPLIELGAGFDFELTARENIYLNGALLGYSKSFIDDSFDEIVEFAEIEGFLDMPLKNFSSGMVSRTAFAVATVIVPDILIVDEALSVGDFMFRRKCEERIQTLIEDYQTTVLLVSHSDTQVERLCNKAVWIEKGHMRISGTAKDVCRTYRLLGGKTGSEVSERKLFDLFRQPIDLPRGYVKEVIEKDSRSFPSTLFRANGLKHDADTVIMVPSRQFYVRVFANALSDHTGWPVLISEADTISDASLTLLENMRPERLLMISQDAMHQFDLSVKMEIERVLGMEPRWIHAQRLSDLALMLYDLGAEHSNWMDVPVLFNPEDSFSLISAYPSIRGEGRAAILYAAHIDCGNLMRGRGYTNQEIESMVFNKEIPELKLADSLRSKRSELASVSRSSTRTYFDSEDVGCMFIVAPKEIYGVAAMQIAKGPNDVILFLDTDDMDEYVETLNLIEELKPISKIVFLGSEDSFTAVDKELVAKAALRH